MYDESEYILDLMQLNLEDRRSEVCSQSNYMKSYQGYINTTFTQANLLAALRYDAIRR